MKKGKRKIAIIVPILIVVALLLVTVCSLTGLKIKTSVIMDDYSAIFQKEEYSVPVYVEGIETIKQDVSCGYAVIEMFGTWAGYDISEESLYSEYGKVVTSTGKSFCAEMNKQFPEYKTSIHKYMKNTELIDAVYETLKKGKPVPFEWAALYGDEWTLHYSIITGMDIPNDKVYIANPYGYNEEITVEEFLSRTSFEAYDKMPLFIKMGFAMGIFEKNTIFIVE